MGNQSRIIRTLELNGICTTSEIAERAGIPFNETETILVEMQELEQVFNVADCDWMLKE